MKMFEPKMSNHAKRVLSWRESFLQLEENQFFEIMKMYLGEIKTPYNKQKLIESLEAFLHKRENLIAIKSLLSKDEIEIICAIVFIKNSTETILAKFFDKTFAYTFLYETLINLEERLILFKTQSKSYNDEFILELNPFLEDAFFDLINLKKLIPDIKCESQKSENIVITSELIASFFSYVIENPALAKQDGSLKKHTIENLEKIFGESKKMISILYKSFLNLSVLKEKKNGVEIDWLKLQNFSNQTFVEQVLYIIASSCGHFSRDSLRYQAQLFIDVIVNLQDKKFTSDIFLRIGFLLQSMKKEVCSEDDDYENTPSRFSKILQEGRAKLSQSHENEFEKKDISSYVFLESMLDAAIELGIFYKCGITEKNENVFCVEKKFYISEINSDVSSKKKLSDMINVEAGFDVNVMPGFELKDYLNMIKFMSLKRYDTVCNYSISKTTIMQGFDFGLTVAQIIDVLQQRMNYQIPQVLLVQLEEWSDSYTSASFYKGFVLKVDQKVAMMIQNNPVFAPHIHTVIAPGIFLLDVNDDEQAALLIKESKLDFIGKIKSATYEKKSLDFCKLNLLGKQISNETDFETPKEVLQPKSQKELLLELNSALKKMNLEEEQKESLELRIEHKVIINSSQLNAGILRLERVKADAMDFGGKIYIIEKAIKNNELIELKFSKNEICVLGKPICIKKNLEEAFVEILLVPENVVKEFALGKASFVKRIRRSLY